MIVKYWCSFTALKHHLRDLISKVTSNSLLQTFKRINLSSQCNISQRGWSCSSCEYGQQSTSRIIVTDWEARQSPDCGVHVQLRAARSERHHKHWECGLSYRPSYLHNKCRGQIRGNFRYQREATYSCVNCHSQPQSVPTSKYNNTQNRVYNLW